jgi:hypothetical protein
LIERHRRAAEPARFLSVVPPRGPAFERPNERRYGTRAIQAVGLITALSASAAAGAFVARESSVPMRMTEPATPVRAVALPFAPVLGLARIASFAVRRDTTSGADSVLASYLAVGDGGELTLFDESGRALAHGNFLRRGNTRITIPARASGGRLDVQLRVRRGASLAVASVTLPALSPQVNERDLPAVHAMPAMPERESGFPGDPFAVIGTPVSGRTFDVRIRRFGASMRLRLEDGAGLIIDETGVAPRADRVVLRTPPSAVARVYFLSATYDTEADSEVLLRRVDVAPG